MRNKPYTSSELFGIIVGQLKEKSMLPNNLDYIQGAKESVPVSSTEIGITNTLDFGANEGIYLDLTLKIYNPGSMIYETVPLGTFKTLDEDRDSMIEMGRILANFVVELRDFINDNLEDFTWSGYTLEPILKDGSKATYTLYVGTYERAIRQAETFLAKPEISRIFIMDNATRDVREYIPNPAANKGVIRWIS